MNARVLLIGSFDSFLAAGVRYAEALKAEGASLDYELLFVRRNQLSDAQRAAAGLPGHLRPRRLEAIAQRSNLERYDVLLVALDGSRTRKFMVKFLNEFKNGRRPVTISFFPGLLARMQLESFMSRASCDLLLLNSPKDFALYAEALRELGIAHNNALCVGLASIPAQGHRHGSARAITFIGQPNVPASRAERSFIVAELLRLAEKYPDTPVLLKPRHRPNERTLHPDRYHFESLATELTKACSRPPNFSVSYDTIDTVLDQTKICLTVSSSVALEAVARGIPTRIISDLGISESYGNQFFLGSGLLAPFEEVRPDLSPVIDMEWRRQNLSSFEEHRGEFVGRVEALMGGSRVSSNGSARLLGRSKAFVDYAQHQFGDQALVDYSGGLPYVGTFKHALQGLRSRFHL